jgi:hypothetical protein
MNNRLPKITNQKFGIEVEFVGADIYAVAEAVRAAGVDCFVEGYNHTTRAYWKIVSDASLHSLRGHAGELVSPILDGVAGALELEKVINALNTVEGVTVNKSCGLHVHLDCRDMTIDQIKTTYERYSNYEEQIDLCMPRSRRGDPRWCAGLARTKDSVKRAATKEGAANVVGRYFKVNLAQIANRGSIEFRQHSGTTEFKKIINWLSFLMQFTKTSIDLVTTAQKSKATIYREVRDLISKWGGEMTWDRKFKKWSIVKDGLILTRITNQYIVDNLYNADSKCRATGMKPITIVADYLNHQGIDFNEIVRANRLPRQTATMADDAGMFMGITTQINDYLAERKDELA